MTHEFGWKDRPADVAAALAAMPMPAFASAAPSLRGTGDGRTSLLWKAFEQVTGRPFPVYQQAIGDCVSWGAAVATQILKCVEIVAGEPEQWEGEIATEPLYALSRIEIGGGRIGREDGSLGAWMARALTEYGTLIRRKYGAVDLSEYSGPRARDWGLPGKGLPDDLEPIAREHPVKTAAVVRTFAELRDAAANGHPAYLCSTVGFDGQKSRDAEGFLAPRGQWPHCMPCIGVVDGPRPAAVIYNQWGKWLEGPRPHDIPECSFLVDAAVIDRMLSHGDSFVLSGYVGFPRRDLPENWAF